MHMSDALITPVVGGTMLATSSGVMGYSIRKIQMEVFEKRLPLMAVMGAFLFSAQMINFAIPGTGSSGHIGGGILLSILLGPAAGFLTMACVLLIQALFFADGGLLAYGCNLINLGFFTAYVAYPLIFKPLMRRGINGKRLMLASILACLVGLQLGSLGVVAETFLSGRTELTLGVFLLFMQPIHMAIGLIEGVITGVVVTYLYGQKADMIYDHSEGHVKGKHSQGRLILRLVIVTLIIGGLVSLLASSNPDGLEWAVAKTTSTEIVANNAPVVEWFEALQNQVAVMPDYGFEGQEVPAFIGTSTAGILGSLITLMVTLLIGALIRKRRRLADDHE